MRILTFNQVKKLRKQIVLNSLFLKDYNNTYTTKENAYNYFDGYVDYLGELSYYHEGTPVNFLDYDNEQNLRAWYEISGGAIC